MTIIYILLAVIIVVNLVWIAVNVSQGDALDERQDELDKYSVHLDERANKLAKWEHELNGPSYVLKPKASEEDQCFSASYCVSDSDLMKYTTDKAVRANAKNRIAMAIAHDIIKRIEPYEETTENGNTKLTYSLKIKKL